MKKKKKKFQPTVTGYELYRKNEVDANRQMIQVSLFTAGFISILLILYAFRVFPLRSYVLVYILFPIAIALLVSTVFWLKRKQLSNPKFKFFLLSCFIAAIALLNVAVPKHAVLGWALCMVLACHYYSRKSVLMTYIVCVSLMLLCLYMGMFYGEYDSNLLLTGAWQNPETGNWEAYLPESFADRVAFLDAQVAAGRNRYLEVFVYFYLPRAATLTLIFLTCYGLNGRTWNMLNSSINLYEQRDRMNAELNVAAEIQTGSLPAPIACGDGFDVLADIIPAKEVGGDLYYYFPLDEKHVALIVGDVSDKGAPAALFMMQTITCLRAYMSIDKSPSETLKAVNKILFEHNEKGMFVTLFYGILNSETGEFKFANAGHNPPVIGRFGDFHLLKCSTGFVLGAMEMAFVKDESITLQKGDIIGMYTDGITEAKNLDGELYGDLRLLKVFNEGRAGTLLELYYGIKKDVKAFCGAAPQSDDRTFLLVQYHGDDIANSDIMLTATLNDTAKAMDFVTRALKKNGLERFNNQMSAATEELFTNIAKYAYDVPGWVYIRLTYSKIDNELLMIIGDGGRPFNPLEVENKAIQKGDGNQQEGGLGISIVKQFMDEVVYQRSEGRNALILKKKIG